MRNKTSKYQYQNTQKKKKITTHHHTKVIQIHSNIQKYKITYQKNDLWVYFEELTNIATAPRMVTGPDLMRPKMPLGVREERMTAGQKLCDTNHRRNGMFRHATNTEAGTKAVMSFVHRKNVPPPQKRCTHSNRCTHVGAMLLID